MKDFKLRDLALADYAIDRKVLNAQYPKVRGRFIWSIVPGDQVVFKELQFDKP